MKLKHNICFVGQNPIKAGTELTKEQVKLLKASGTKYHEVKEAKKKEEKPSKDGK